MTTIGGSFEGFCLIAGVATLAKMMEEDATALRGCRQERPEHKSADRWGKIESRGRTFLRARPSAWPNG